MYNVQNLQMSTSFHNINILTLTQLILCTFKSNQNQIKFNFVAKK